MRVPNPFFVFLERFFTAPFCVAEKEGFEPSRQLPHPTPLAGEPLRPLGYFSTAYKIYSSGGERGIRTPGAFRHHWFSRPAPSTTRPSLLELTSELYYTRESAPCQPPISKKHRNLYGEERELFIMPFLKKCAMSHCKTVLPLFSVYVRQKVICPVHQITALHPIVVIEIVFWCIEIYILIGIAGCIKGDSIPC